MGWLKEFGESRLVIYGENGDWFPRIRIDPPCTDEDTLDTLRREFNNAGVVNLLPFDWFPIQYGYGHKPDPSP